MAVTIKGSGQVPVQVVSTTKLDSFSSTSTTMVDITGLSVNITPTNSSNKILIIASLVVGADTWASGGGMAVNLVRNSTNLSVGTSGTSINATSGFNSYAGNQTDTRGNFSPMVITFVDSPNTTSSTTYKLQGRIYTVATNFVINRRENDTQLGFGSTITVMEISG
jgi:hypothetical protein